MRFWQAVAMLLACFSIANAANLPVRKQRDNGEALGKRQAVGVTICARVGPLSIRVLTVTVPIVDTICLCTVGGVLTQDSIARLTTEFQADQQAGLLSPLIGLLGNTAETLLNLLLGNGRNAVNNSGTVPCNTGTTTSPNGFPTCPPANSPPGTCAFGCNTGFKVCGTGCIPTAQVCPSGSISTRSMSARNICPAGWQACPIQTAKGLIHECVNTSSDLESCGGCPGFTNGGVDCSALPGVGTVTCVEGRCKVHNCMRGFNNATESGCTKKAAHLSTSTTGVLFQ